MNPTGAKFANQSATETSGANKDGHITKHINHSGSRICKEESMAHKEADTRMIFHTSFANGQLHQRGQVERIIITSPDTDVLMLALHYFPQMKTVEELSFETRRIIRITDQRRYITE